MTSLVASTSLTRRKTMNTLMFSITCVCMVTTLAMLIVILGYLAWQGGSAIDWDFLTKLPKPVGEVGGGVANAIVGSGKLLLMAGCVGVPIGMMAGIYLSEFGDNIIGVLIRYFSDVLNGVPSVVVGIFAYAVIVKPMGHFSALAGGFALGIMMIPIAVRTTEEFMRLVPQSLREAAYALGIPRWKTILFVVIPTAGRAIITGILLDFARVAGETAPLLFTAFGNRFWSQGILEPTGSLPVIIYTYAISPYDDWHRQAMAAGLLLLLFVLGAGILARVILRKPVHV